ncbi:hypothetical protein [Sebaldella termitidis]|uniref:hypothetical protein n=1 Tax=Sebaldella termitidis TaxID=826 RepID=UPI003EBF0017
MNTHELLKNMKVSTKFYLIQDLKKYCRLMKETDASEENSDIVIVKRMIRLHNKGGKDLIDEIENHRAEKNKSYDDIIEELGK